MALGLLYSVPEAWPVVTHIGYKAKEGLRWGQGGQRGKRVTCLGNLEMVPLRSRRAKSEDLKNQQTLVKSLLCTMYFIICQGYVTPIGL